jgi:hypothetical protein
MRWADRLATARRRGFVGRATELSRFQALLADPDEPRVVYVHGPGGVGKTALLHQFAWLAEQAGRRCVWLDGPEVHPDAVTVVGLLGPLEDDLVLLVDGVEGLDRLLREEVLSRLAAEAVVVLTGRDRPSAQWRTDPGWRELVEVMPLGNLAEADGRKLLLDRGVAADDCGPALAFTRGHPLALALVADVAAQRRFSVAEAPGVVKTLLRGLVDSVPSPQHRLALEGTAQVLSVTEPLLAALLDQPDVGELFEWLRGLSIIEPGPRGLFPHDLVRDVLATELEWRDPDAHAALHERAAAYYRDQFDRADPQARRWLLLDFLYLQRERSVLGPFLNAVTGRLDSRRLWASAPRPEEWPLLREWVDRHEGEDSAALFDHWRTRQPEATSVVRDGQGTPVGFYVPLHVEHADAADRAADPALDGLPRDFGTGECAKFVRFWMESDAYQQVGEVQAFLSLHLSRTYLSSPGLAWTFIAFAEPDFWADGCAYLDYHRIGTADFTIGGRTYGVYGHDWREVPPLGWLSLLAQREDQAEARAEAPALDRAEFGLAVKEALRRLGHAEGLRHSPLLDTGLVPGGLAERERVAALREAIADAAAELEASPRDRRAFRALHHTYLRPAATQQAAADLLDLPMSTFRRHLAEGIERLTDLLWQRARAG